MGQIRSNSGIPQGSKPYRSIAYFSVWTHGPENVDFILGCVKAGHPYIPIDTSIPLERVANIIENSKTELVINVSGLPLPIVYPSIRIVNQREIENDDNNA